MRPKALIIRHMKQMHGDRVSDWLKANGFELDYRCPAEGQPLPEGHEGHRLTVVYGGVQSANDNGYIEDEIAWIERWVEEGRPYLGLCLGGQLLARALGARVDRHPEGLHELGFVEIRPGGDADFLPAPLQVYQWHKEGFELPGDAELLAEGETFANQAFSFGDTAYALQFHPEVTEKIMRGWMVDGAESLSAPGAAPKAQQLADAARYGEDMAVWLETFLRRRILPLTVPEALDAIPPGSG